MTYTIKIPTANLRRSTMANSQKVYLGDSNKDRQSEMAAETVYVSMYTSGFDRHLDFHNEWVVGGHSFDVIHLLCHVRKQQYNILRQPAMCCRWWPITTSGIVRHLENVPLPLYVLREVIFSFVHSKLSRLWSLHLRFTGVQCRYSQPDISIWPPKPEIITYLELWQIASKFQCRIRDFRRRRARYKTSQMIATTIDYQKLQDWRPKRLYNTTQYNKSI